jgi:hypothetical protein
VTINTTGLSGTSGYLVVDFLSGGGPADNAISIAGFTSDGTLGATSSSGDVINTLTASPGYVIMITDPVNSAFNEYQNAFTFGSTMSFFLTATTNAPGPGSSPDEASMYFLASDDMTSLVTTSDPTVSNTLFTLDIDGSVNGIPTVYSVSNPSDVSATMTLYQLPSPTPEPSAWPVVAALGLFGLYKRRAATRLIRRATADSSRPV